MSHLNDVDEIGQPGFAAQTQPQGRPGQPGQGFEPQGRPGQPGQGFEPQQQPGFAAQMQPGAQLGQGFEPQQQPGQLGQPGFVPLAPAEQERSFRRPRREVEPQDKRRNFLRELLEFVILIVIAVVITTLLKTFVIDQYSIPTGSMEPTIEIDDHLFAEKVSYRFALPTPGDIVTFYDPSDPDRILIKRCIAVGGQTVDVKNGQVYVDGQALTEPYTRNKPSEPLEKQLSGVSISYPYRVPSDMVWVMGDNRTNSLDSRFFGPIPHDQLIGKALFRFLPFDRFGAID
jgi:signal peptidase I